MTSTPTFAGIAEQLARQQIELPSWAFGNSGTPFQGVQHAGHPA